MRLIDADALAEKKFQERECNGLGEGPAYRQGWNDAIDAVMDNEPSAQPDTEKICARIKAEAIKRNVEYMKHGDRYMLGFVDGMRLARRIVDGTVDNPVYFTTSGE